MRAILTFHSIDNKGSVISYPPDAFKKLLASLSRKNIPIVDLDTLIKPDTKSGVALTFDDGMQSVFKHAMPVIKDHNACAHVYVTTSAVNNDNPWPKQPTDIPSFKMLTWDEMAEMYKNNIYTENHTHTHPNFRQLTLQQMQDECGKSDDIIEAHLGRRPKHFAYPFGYHNTVARNFARDRYTTTVTTELKPFSNSSDLAAIPRLDSYYLQSDWFIHNIDSLLVKGYLSLRNKLRNIKGSQNKADCK